MKMPQRRGLSLDNTFIDHFHQIPQCHPGHHEGAIQGSCVDFRWYTMETAGLGRGRIRVQSFIQSYHKPAGKWKRRHGHRVNTVVQSAQGFFVA